MLAPNALLYRPPRGLAGGVIEEARDRQRRQRAVLGGSITLAAAAILVAFVWGGAGAGRPSSLGGPHPNPRRVAGSGGVRSARVLSSLGLSVVEPAGWFGRSMVLAIGGPGAAWLQTSNLSLQPAKPGVDPIESMGPDGVVVTITTVGPFSSPIRPTVQPLTVARDAIPARRTPHGHRGLVLDESAMLGGGLVSISAYFPSRSAVPHLLPIVNDVVRSLREQLRR